VSCINCDHCWCLD